ncbi:MAG: CSLREA domain-containing protein, partial [Gemmatimonadota bacterium]|nr:CSLREA domain-containing protein [Gemmatimonadota bacterium]
MRKAILLFTVAGATLLTLFAANGIVPHPALAQEASTYAVNTTGDSADANAGNGICATAQNTCSLRAAIQEANLRSGPDAITFNIPGTGVRTIQLGSQLPSLSDASGPTTIDGYTQPGSAPNTDPSASNASIGVQLTTATAYAVGGITVTSPNNTIRGLSLFKLKNPILLYGSNANDNTVAGNFIGTDAAGNYTASAFVGAGDGVYMQNGAKRNTIGGTAAADRNVISGNARRGVAVAGLTSDYNRVLGNVIGLGPKGDKRLPNLKHGVDLNSGASQNQVGGTQPGERNVISGNTEEGVEISHLDTTTENRVIGNYIGTDVTGEAAPAYSYNGEYGVHLEDLVTNNEVAENVVGNNRKGGVRVGHNTTNNRVHDNEIGVSRGGRPIPNSSAGVQLDTNSDNNEVGPNNVIANNPVGIRITTDDSDYNTITRNSIFGNTGLGIDLRPLGSANQNDAGDADAGANEQLNFPVIGSATPQKVSGDACGGCT